MALSTMNRLHITTWCIAADVALSLFPTAAVFTADARKKGFSAATTEAWESLSSNLQTALYYQRTDPTEYGPYATVGMVELLDNFLKSALTDVGRAALKDGYGGSVKHVRKERFGSYDRPDLVRGDLLADTYVTRFALSVQSALMDALMDVHRGVSKHVIPTVCVDHPVHVLTEQVRELWKAIPWVPYVVNLAQPEMDGNVVEVTAEERLPPGMP